MIDKNTIEESKELKDDSELEQVEIVNTNSNTSNNNSNSDIELIIDDVSLRKQLTNGKNHSFIFKFILI